MPQDGGMFGRKTSDPAVLLSRDGRILATFVEDQSHDEPQSTADVDITTPVGPRTAPAPVREKSRLYEAHLFDNHGTTAQSADGRCRVCTRIRESWCETSVVAVCRVPKRAFAEFAVNHGLTESEVRATYYRGINRLLVDAGAHPIPGYDVPQREAVQEAPQPQRSTVRETVPQQPDKQSYAFPTGRKWLDTLRSL
jgi:hypothetical protein